MQFFRFNTEGISEAIVWEFHKAYIRGILIMAGSERKKRTKEIKIALMKEIHNLEQLHKTTRDIDLSLKLSCKRETMRDLIEQETLTAYNLVKRERYQYWNIWRGYQGKTKAANYIEKIQTSTGEPVHKTAEIAKVFQEY